MRIAEKSIIDFEIFRNKTQHLLVPKIMPDEYLMGYATRVATLNRYSSVADLRRFLASHLPMGPGRATPLLICLSHLLKVSASDLCKNHTVYEIFTYNNSKHNSEDLLLKSHFAAFNKKIRFEFAPTYFCQKCASEDLGKLGFSYWRKSHQTLEKDFCDRHHCLLDSVSYDTKFLHTPLWYMNGNSA